LAFCGRAHSMRTTGLPTATAWRRRQPADRRRRFRRWPFGARPDFFFAAAEFLHLRQDTPGYHGAVDGGAPAGSGPCSPFWISFLRLMARRWTSESRIASSSPIQAASTRVPFARPPPAGADLAFLRAAVTPSWNELGYAQVNLSQYRNTVAALGVTHEGSRWTHTPASVSAVRGGNQAARNPETADFYSAFPSMAADFLSLSVGAPVPSHSARAAATGRTRLRSRTPRLRIGHHNVQAGATTSIAAAAQRTGRGLMIAFSTYNDPTYGPAAPVWVTQSEVPWIRSASTRRRASCAIRGMSLSASPLCGCSRRWLGAPRFRCIVSSFGQRNQLVDPVRSARSRDAALHPAIAPNPSVSSHGVPA